MSQAETPHRDPEPLREGHPFRQWKTWTIPGTRLTVAGYSRSNDKTFFHLPELKCCIDAGLCEGRRVDTVFLTHTHHDHAADLEYLAGKETGVDVYPPAEARDYIEAYIRAKRELNHVGPYDPALAAPCRLHAVRAGDTFAFGRQGQYRVRVVPCVHKVPCVGYAFSEVRGRLKPEFEQLKTEMVGQGKMAEFGAGWPGFGRPAIRSRNNTRRPSSPSWGHARERLRPNPVAVRLSGDFHGMYLPARQRARARQPHRSPRPRDVRRASDGRSQPEPPALPESERITRR